jgi:2-dehydro-3-deoxygluconokinase
MDVVSLGETMILFTPETQGLLRYAKSFSTKFAGAETNTLIGLSRLGHRTGWISRVGKDEFGSMLTSAICGEGIDISQVSIDPKAPTGIFFKEFFNQKSVRVYYYRKDSAASQLNVKNIKEEYIANAKYLYITGITPALSDSCCEAIFQAIIFAKKHSVQIVFDPNIRRKLWSDEKAKDTLLQIAKEADIILPGISEGEFLCGTDVKEEIAQQFLSLGASLVVVKLGAEGAYYQTNYESGTAPGLKVDRVIDPVGAGDGFAAGVLSGLLDGLSVHESVERGCAIGAMVVMVNGDIEGLPDRELLAEFIQSSNQDGVLR